MPAILARRARATTSFDTPKTAALDSGAMLDMVWVRDHFDEVEAALRKRGGGGVDVAALRRLDTERRAALTEVEALKARRNAASGTIAKIKKEGGDASAILDEMRAA